ncbi:RNA-binding S4 domain-containing protein [Nocardioides aurantiacus]|uniref:RNA-binding S4 domain-containing protein n=1 Tax=Nocardioides aurantiacus TaxID=86796 RepID=UPI00403F6F89
MNPFRRRRAEPAPQDQPAGPPPPEDVPIRDEVIRLGQFLKLANLVENGSDAKVVLGEGRVTVNDEPESRRGRQLVVGDVVELGGVRSRVASGGGDVDVPW